MLIYHENALFAKASEWVSEGLTPSRRMLEFKSTNGDDTTITALKVTTCVANTCRSSALLRSKTFSAIWNHTHTSNSQPQQSLSVQTSTQQVHMSVGPQSSDKDEGLALACRRLIAQKRRFSKTDVWLHLRADLLDNNEWSRVASFWKLACTGHEIYDKS